MDLVLPKPGSYIVAVSGGVDSVSLLHALQEIDGLKLVVAHFDHGIREDSRQDRLFVKNLAAHYGLPFIYDEGNLGPGASEALAREVRYQFLRKVKQTAGAQAIITAHHQDDLLETAILNLHRGTGRKGLTSLGSSDELVRPLLATPKADIISYATQQNLSWQEDSTNHDDRYARNYIRHQLLAELEPSTRQQLLEIITQQLQVNAQLDILLAQQLATHSSDGAVDRQWFVSLPHAEAKEILAAWLRSHGSADFDRRTLERLTTAVKVARPGKQFDVSRGKVILVDKHKLALKPRER